MPEAYAQTPLFATERQCVKCGQAKSLSEFQFRRDTNDYRRICRECHETQKREYVAANRESIAAQRHSFYVANRDRLLAKQLAYAEKNREIENARARIWGKEHPDRARRKHISYYVRYRADVLAKKRDYGRRKPDIIRANRRQREARKRGAGGTITVAEWREIVAYFGGHCAYCGCKPDILSQDHVIPISKGGQHVKENVVPACMPCNNRKYNHSLMAFLQLAAASTFTEQIAAKMK